MVLLLGVTHWAAGLRGAAAFQLQHSSRGLLQQGPRLAPLRRQQGVRARGLLRGTYVRHTYVATIHNRGTHTKQAKIDVVVRPIE